MTDAVTLPQIAPESLGTPLRCEDLGPGAPFEAELVAPCGQHDTYDVRLHGIII